MIILIPRNMKHRPINVWSLTLLWRSGNPLQSVGYRDDLYLRSFSPLLILTNRLFVLSVQVAQPTLSLTYLTTIVDMLHTSCWIGSQVLLVSSWPRHCTRMSTSPSVFTDQLRNFFTMNLYTSCCVDSINSLVMTSTGTAMCRIFFSANLIRSHHPIGTHHIPLRWLY